MALPQPKRRRLGDILISEGLITPDQLDHALAEQKRHGGKLGTILKTLGIVSEIDIAKTIAAQMKIPHVSLTTMIVDPDVVGLITEGLARRHQVIPVAKKEHLLTLAMADPLNIYALDEVRQVTGLEVESVIATETEVMGAIDRFYGVSSTMEQAMKDVDVQGRPGRPERTEGEDAPVVKLVNSILGQAVREGASDIHIEPDQEVVRVRYRVDGLLREAMTPPRALHAGITSRVKIMADLDIAEKRIPQDGRIETKVGDREVDIRVSTLPTIFGEKVVLRLLDKSGTSYRMEDLGFPADMLDLFRSVIRKPYGLILVTGPTGSGKTTTIYGALQAIRSVTQNIVTIEDPVEYQIGMINQVPVNPKVGVTFATGLRSILRQDPDVIMVGEIRDRETATIAIQAALTGHLVFSTLHTNDSPGAVTRLIDIGVEPFLISSSLLCVLAQRLVRRICSHCGQPDRPPPELLSGLGLAEKKVSFRKGAGCPECRQTGYLGRIGIYEMLSISESLRELIVRRSSSSQLKAAAIKTGFRPLRIQGLIQAAQGVTTLEEVLRVTQDLESG